MVKKYDQSQHFGVSLFPDSLKHVVTHVEYMVQDGIYPRCGSKIPSLGAELLNCLRLFWKTWTADADEARPLLDQFCWNVSEPAEPSRLSRYPHAFLKWGCLKATHSCHPSDVSLMETAPNKKGNIIATWSMFKFCETNPQNNNINPNLGWNMRPGATPAYRSSCASPSLVRTAPVRTGGFMVYGWFRVGSGFRVGSIWAVFTG